MQRRMVRRDRCRASAASRERISASRLIENFSEQVRAFALTLPRGRFLADGKLHLDLVNREVIDRLLALRAADQPKGENGKPQPGTGYVELSRQNPVSPRRRMRRARPCPQRERPKQKTGRRGIGRRRPQRRQGRSVHRAPLLSRARRRLVQQIDGIGGSRSQTC